MRPSEVDLSTRVGAVALRSPILTASGTSGHDDELAAYGDLAELGAVVVKSLMVEPWPGNAAPRVAPAGEGMVNAVGLQGPGVGAWLADGLPRLEARGATVVASIWGRTTDEFARAAEALRGAPVAAVEVNVELSQPARRLGDVRALADRDGGGGRRRDAQRPAVLGEAQPERPTASSTSRAPPSTPARRHSCS